jgi:hypothetical protein
MLAAMRPGALGLAALPLCLAALLGCSGASQCECAIDDSGPIDVPAAQGGDDVRAITADTCLAQRITGDPTTIFIYSSSGADCQIAVTLDSGTIVSALIKFQTIHNGCCGDQRYPTQPAAWSGPMSVDAGAG